jgi:hypothetical protein
MDLPSGTDCLFGPYFYLHWLKREQSSAATKEGCEARHSLRPLRVRLLRACGGFPALVLRLGVGDPQHKRVLSRSGLAVVPHKLEVRAVLCLGGSCDAVEGDGVVKPLLAIFDKVLELARTMGLKDDDTLNVPMKIGTLKNLIRLLSEHEEEGEEWKP